MSKRYHGPVSDHFDGKRFSYPGGNADKTFADLIKWQLGSNKTPWPKWVENQGVATPATGVGRDEVVISFVNHATVLVQIAGLNILTDPVWSERTSPVSWAGPKRVRSPGLPMEQLPKIDLVLVSHNHYDHLDVPTLRQLSEKLSPRIMVPLGDKGWLSEKGVRHVEEYDWWQTQPIVDGVEVVFVPAKHWSARSTFDHRMSLWGGFVIRAYGKNIYFAGDTGYDDLFVRLRQRLGPMDFSLLPIGAYEPRWFMRAQHMNPEEAVQAHIDLQSRMTMGIHFGTWQLTDEGMDEPVKELEIARKKLGVLPENFFTLEVGETRRLKLSTQVVSQPSRP